MSKWLAAAFVLAAAQTGFAQIYPHSPAEAAKVISLTGQVSVLRDSEPWALNEGDLVQMQQVILTGPDGYAKFQTSDGSTFEVYPNSNIIFRNNPGSLEDLLDMFIGRVKIHIQRMGGRPNPNHVKTPTAVISVRGTTFDVSVDGDDDETTVVTVEEGSVEVRHALMPGSERVVNAGESLHVYKDAPLAKSRIDKGELFQRILRGLNDAAYRVAIMSPTHGGIGIPGGGGTNGDTHAPAPPPTAPPPPPSSAPSAPPPG